MSRIMIDAYAEELKDKKGKIVEGKDGKSVYLFRPRIKLMEGDNVDSFTLKVWEDIWESRGNTYTANTDFEIDKKPISFRQVCLRQNGTVDEVEVKTRDKVKVYNITSGLCESFARVATQTRIAQDEIRNSRSIK